MNFSSYLCGIMKLKYTNMDSVVIGTHTQDERKFQVTNHYNMVEGEINRAFDAINDLKKKLIKDCDWETIYLIESVEHHLGNVKTQHYNEGYELKCIEVLGIKSEVE